MLAEKLESEPDYPLPEGYTKIKELKPVVSHQIPPNTAAIIGEAQTASIGVVD